MELPVPVKERDGLREEVSFVEVAVHNQTREPDPQPTEAPAAAAPPSTQAQAGATGVEPKGAGLHLRAIVSAVVAVLAAFATGVLAVNARMTETYSAYSIGI